VKQKSNHHQVNGLETKALSNGKNNLTIFIWKQNPDTGEYEKVPFHFDPDQTFFERWITVDSEKISPDQFWSEYVDYQYFPSNKSQTTNTHYNEDILDAIDMIVDEMDDYPEANSIIKNIQNNLGGDNED
jgi:hypothetical protein